MAINCKIILTPIPYRITMASSILTQAAIIVAVSVAGVLYLNSRDEPIHNPLASKTDNSMDRIATLTELEPDLSLGYNSASVVSIPRRNGHFYTYGKANNGAVEFLVDTGASVVALTKDDARKAGVDMGRLVFDRPVQTAAGKTYAAAIRLDYLSIGGIQVRDVRAVVMEDGLNQSLLGMSFLGELQKVEATPEMLTLRY